MPSAVVIPAPIVYIKVVAVKKIVVEFLVGMIGPALICRYAYCLRPSFGGACLALSCRAGDTHYLI